MVNLDLVESELMLDEGFRSRPYLDTATPPRVTIGFGRNLTDKPLTKAEGLFLLRNDLLDAVHELDARLPWWRGLDDVRGAVLINMAYNLGGARLMGFVKMLAALRAGDYATAAAEGRDSQWFTQVGGRGVRLMQSLETGTR